MSYLLLPCFPSSFKQHLIMTTFVLVFLTHKYSKKIKCSPVFPLEYPHHGLAKGRGQELTHSNMQGPTLHVLFTWPHFLWSPLSLGHRDISSYRICLLCYLADFWTWPSLASLFSQLCKKIWNGELFSSDIKEKKKLQRVTCPRFEYPKWNKNYFLVKMSTAKDLHKPPEI